MQNNKFIQVLVDDEIHYEYRKLLRSRRKGERIKYVCGDMVNRAMKRKLDKEKKDGHKTYESL